MKLESKRWKKSSHLGSFPGMTMAGCPPLLEKDLKKKKKRKGGEINTSKQCTLTTATTH